MAERVVFLAVVAAMLLAFGATDALPLSVAGTALFALAAWVLARRPVEPAHRAVGFAVVAIASLLALWMMVQSALPMASAAADGQAAIVPAMLPFAVFVLALLLWPTDAAARQLLQIIGVGGALLAAYGFVQLSLSPGKVLFVRPTPYRDSLVATLPTPDAAAIVLGSVAILLSIRSVDRIGRVVRGAGTPGEVLGALLCSAAALLTLTALLATRSPVGIGAAIIGLAGAMGLAAALSGSRRSPRRDRRGVARRIAIGAGVGVATAVTVGLLAARTLAASAGGGDSTCAFPMLFRMLGEHWLAGVGAGSFHITGLAYADPACALSQTGMTEYSGLLLGWIALGVPVVLVTAAVAALLARTMARGLATRRRLRWAPIAGAGIMVSVALSLVWTSSAYVPGVAVLLAVLLAPVCAICLNDTQHSGEQA